MKKPIRSPLFVAIVSAPVLFGIGALLLSFGNYEGPWYYILYFLLHILAAGAYFFGLHLFFRALPERGVMRAIAAAIPMLVSLSVYHFAIAFYDAFAVQFEDAPAALLYALLSLFTDSLVAEWLLLFLSAVAAWFFFLRGGETTARRRAAFLLSALLFFAYLSVGRVVEFVSFCASRFGVAGESATVSFLLFAGSDLLISALGFLVLFLSDRAEQKEVLQ